MIDWRIEYFWRVKFRDGTILEQDGKTKLDKLVENVEWFEYVPVDNTRLKLHLDFEEGEILHRFIVGYDAPPYGYTRYKFVAGKKGGKYFAIQPGFVIFKGDRIIRFNGCIEEIDDPNKFCALDEFTDQF